MAGSGFSVGRVYVSIVPDVARFSAELAAGVLPTANQVGNTAGRQMGDAIAKSIAAAIQAGLAAGGAGAGAAGARSGDAYGGEFDRVVRTKIEAALRSIPPVSLNVATSEAEQKLRDIRLEMESLAGARIGIDIDDEAALEKVRDLRVRLIELAATSPNIQVQTDTEAAILHLDELLVKVAELANTRPTIQADADTANAERKLDELRLKAIETGGGFSTLLIAGLALGPTLIPIIAAVTAAVAGLAATLAAVGIAGGVLALGLSGVHKTMQDLTQEQTKQAASSARNGASAAAAAAAQANAAAQLKSAEASLANTRANAAESARKAAEAVKNAKTAETQAEVDARDKINAAIRSVMDAREAYERAVETAASNISSTQDALAKAERNLADAQTAATDAQNGLTEARKTAQQQLEDLANQVTDGELAARQADLQVNSARDNLANTNASPLSTADQKAQAQLDYDTALQRVKELATQNARLAKEKADADAKGIEGSDAVVQAQQNIVDANQKVTDSQKAVSDAATAAAKAQTDGARQVRDAQRAINDAETKVAKAQVDGAASIVKAQQAVTDAIKAQADQQRQAAFSIAQALASVAAAQRGVQDAARGAGGGGAAAVDAIQQRLDKVDPATLKFAKFLLSLRPEFAKLKSAAAGGLLPGLEEAIKILLPALPGLVTFVGKVAKALGDLAVQGAKSITNPEWRRFFGYLGSSVIPIFSTFAKIIGNVALGFGGLLRGFGGTTESIGKSLLGLSERFAKFGDNAGQGKSSGFNAFLAYIKSSAPTVIQTFKDIGRVIGHLIEGLAGSGVSILKFVDSIAKFLANLDPSTLANIYKAITGILIAFKAFSIVSKIISGIVVVLEFLWPIIEFIGALVATTAGIIIVVIAAIVAALVIMYFKWQAFRDIVDAVWHAVVATVLDAWNNYILPTLKAIGDWFANVLGPAIVDFYNSVIVPTWQAISAFIVDAWTNYIQPTLKAIGDWIVNVLAPAIADFYHNVIVPIFKAIGTVIQTVWLDVIAPALNDFWLFIKDVLWPIIQLWYNVVVKPIFDLVGKAVASVWNEVIYPALHAMWDFLKNTLGPEISHLWETYAKPALHDLGEAATTLWQKYIKPAFEAVGTIIEDAWTKVIKPALDGVHGALDAIGQGFKDFRQTAANVWYDIEGFFVNGVNKVIHVINSLTHALSSIPGVPIHIDPIPDVSEPTKPAGFSRGGVLPGYSFQDRIHAMLSPGEGILVPEAVIALGGAHGIDHINYVLSGGRGGRPNNGPRFSIGGVIGDIGGIIKKVGGAVLSPAEHAAINAAEAAAHSVAGQLLPSGIFRVMADGFIDTIGNALKFDNGGWLMPGAVGVNLSGQPEPVFNADQWATLSAAVTALGRLDPATAGGRGGGHTFHTEVHNNGQPITPAAVIEAQNRNVTMHDLPQLVGIG